MKPLTGQQNLVGTRILILEDDFYLATDLQAVLEQSGATVIGPFPDAKGVLTIMATHKPHCALVDLNLGSSPSFELPHALLKENVPFAFVTGYDRESIPAEFANIECLQKPVALSRALATTVKLLGS